MGTWSLAEDSGIGSPLLRSPPLPPEEGSSQWPLCWPVAVATQDIPDGNALSFGCLSSLFGFHIPDLSAKLGFFAKISFRASLEA